MTRLLYPQTYMSSLLIKTYAGMLFVPSIISMPLYSFCGTVSCLIVTCSD